MDFLLVLIELFSIGVMANECLTTLSLTLLIINVKKQSL